MVAEGNPLCCAPHRISLSCFFWNGAQFVEARIHLHEDISGRLHDAVVHAYSLPEEVDTRVVQTQMLDGGENVRGQSFGNGRDLIQR